MEGLKKRGSVAGIVLFWGLFSFTSQGWAEAGCAPCGLISNLPMPPYDPNGVQPFENYLARTECACVAARTGFYFGAGFGYGAVNYNLNIPGIGTNNTSNSYVTERVDIGFSLIRRCFFLGIELGYNYRSVTGPTFYEDPSTVTEIALLPPLPPVEVAAVQSTPCTVRLNINSQNAGTFDLLPGFSLASRLSVYGRIGVEFASYTWRRRVCFPAVAIATEGLAIGTIVADEEFGENQTDAIVSGRLGLGASYAAGPHLRFNVDFIHMTGSTGKFTPNNTRFERLLAITPNVPIPIVPQPVIANTDTLTAENTIKPTRNEVFLGMTLTF